MSLGASSDSLLRTARAALDRDPSASMASLAAATGVSLRQLYRRFGSRANLLRELDVDAHPGPRERILAAAFDMLGQSSLADLSMDELAARADVSRATVYRLFPGKSALFRDLIASYSPWEPIARVLDQQADPVDAPPEHVIPAVAAALTEALADRSAVLVRMVFEMSRGDPDVAGGVRRSMTRGLPDLVAYLTRQMALGRLRRVEPLIALQLLAGPILAHELTRPLAAALGETAPREQVVGQVVELWLRAMAPD